MLTAHHSMWLFGLEFLHIHYKIEKLHRSKKGLDGFQAFYVWVIVIEICLFSSLSQTR